MTRKRRWSERSKYAPRGGVTVAVAIMTSDWIDGRADLYEFYRWLRFESDHSVGRCRAEPGALCGRCTAASIVESIALSNDPEDFDALMGGGR